MIAWARTRYQPGTLRARASLAQTQATNPPPVRGRTFTGFSFGQGAQISLQCLEAVVRTVNFAGWNYRPQVTETSQRFRAS